MRLLKFRRSTRLGAIFICSSCHQKLFDNQVEELDQSMEENLMETDTELYVKCIPAGQKVLVEVTSIEENGIPRTESHYYICKKCHKSLGLGRMPKYCIENGLKLDNIPPEMRLTELESNLIAKNIIFQKFPKKQSPGGVEHMTI